MKSSHELESRLSLKRAIDVVGASVCLLIVSPVMLLAALGILLAMGPPILFRQMRPGLRGHPFVLYKFRTMLDLPQEGRDAVPDAKRLTRLGRFLRTTSLDELPGLFNVLRGEMSLVGPRPLRMQYLDRYTPEQMRRHEVKPGITGWAQINGRNAITWEEKFKLDVWYVDHWSLWLDFKILAMTVWKTLRLEGISPRGHATMPEFLGARDLPGDSSANEGRS